MPPRPAKPSVKAQSKLLEAVKFLSLITTEEGTVNETHILLSNKTATAFDGKLGAGVLIDEDLYLAPHAKTFLNALSKCGEQYSLTQLDQSKLSIKSGKFKAIVPCIDPTLLSFPNPDPVASSVDDKFKKSLETIEKIKPEVSDLRPATMAFCLNGKTVLATDGKIVVESWHGFNLPIGMPIPKNVIPAIINNSKKLVSLGYSNNSCTFFFEDNSFIKTQLVAGEWPLKNVDLIFNKPNNPQAIPEDFFKGLESILPFTEGMIYFKDGLISSKKENELAGASFEIANLKSGPIYNPKYLILIKDIATHIDFHVPSERQSFMLMFTGINVRGALMGIG